MIPTGETQGPNPTLPIPDPKPSITFPNLLPPSPDPTISSHLPAPLPHEHDNTMRPGWGKLE